MSRESERLTEVDGTTFHSHEAGTGPTLIALHGGGPGANAWHNTRHSFVALSQHFEVILLDLPGYGQSTRFPAHDGETEDRVYARALLAFMDAREISQAHFFAPSMSSGCVLRLAINHPDRVGRLVLKSPGGMPNPFAPSPTAGLLALFEYGKNPSREAMEKVMRLFIPRADFLRPEMVDERYAAALATPAPAPVGPSISLAPELGSVRAPVLVLWGRDDHVVPFASAFTVLAGIPNCQLHVWGGGTGHFVEWEHPREFSQLVTNFLLDDRRDDDDDIEGASA
jgi:4,5:9,10-diseco-3-hydroxy-5,9,17-trioxoandrosta-1(10),2-diene-4-oate hydrolase